MIFAAPNAAAPNAKPIPEPTSVTISKTTQARVPTGMATRHHRPNTRPTSNIVAIMCDSLARRHERLRPPVELADPVVGDEARLAGADGSLEAADPLQEHVPLLHRTPRCILRLASRTGVLEERPPFLVDRARVRRVVDGEPRAASLGPTDTAGRIGWGWGSQRPGQHPPQGALVRRCRSHGSPDPQASP